MCRVSSQKYGWKNWENVNLHFYYYLFCPLLPSDDRNNWQVYQKDDQHWSQCPRIIWLRENVTLHYHLSLDGFQIFRISLQFRKLQPKHIWKGRSFLNATKYSVFNESNYALEEIRSIFFGQCFTIRPLKPKKKMDAAYFALNIHMDYKGNCSRS